MTRPHEGRGTIQKSLFEWRGKSKDIKEGRCDSAAKERVTVSKTKEHLLNGIQVRDGGHITDEGKGFVTTYDRKRER